jgi:hypothetical protein
MAVQTIYLANMFNTPPVAPNYFGVTSLNAAPSPGSGDGWTPSTTALTTPYFRAYAGSTNTAQATGQAASWNAATTGPTKGTTAILSGDSYIAGPFNGIFAATAWTFTLNLIADINKTGATGHVNIQVWKSANADGSVATKLLTNTPGTTVTLAASGLPGYNSSLTWTPGALTLSNEYLFFQIEWQETTVGTLSGCDVRYRVSTCYVTTPDMAPGPVAWQAAASINGAGGVGATSVDLAFAQALIAGTGGAPVNYIPNPRAQGATVGTPGVMPLYWAYYATNGVTTSVVGFGTQADGTPYVDLRYNGTPTGTYVVGVFNNTAATSSGANVPWVGAVSVAMVGGSMANIASVDVELRSSLPTVVTTFTPTAMLTRYSITTTTSGSMNGQTFGWGLSITAGLPIDITLRFALPQLEIGTVPTAPILPVGQYVAAGQPRGIFANASGGRDVSPNHFTLNFQPGGQRAFTGNLGVQFTPTVALTFNRIGIRCPVTGTGVRTVMLLNVTTSTLVQSVTIDLTGATPGVYYYTALTQVTLTAGSTYYLCTAVNTADGQLWPDSGATMLRGATAVNCAYDNGAPGTPTLPPLLSYPDTQFYGLDLDLVTTPVVANATIAGLGGWTNYVHNPRAEGAVVGTPGTLPTYWSNTLSDAGLAQQIVATGTDATSGLGYVDIRIFGTPSASSTFFIVLDAFNVSLAPGDRFTVTEWLAVVGGSVTNLANVIVVAYYNPVVDSIGAGDVRTLLTATLTPYGGTGIARNDVTSLGAPRLQVGYTASQPIDVTFRIAGPQLERGSVRTLPIYPPAGAPQIMTRPLLAAPGVGINASARIDGSGGTTNYVRNPRVEGAVVGTPGTLPTFWADGGVPAGITRQIVATGTDAATGLTYFDIRYSGTLTGGANFYIYTDFAVPLPVIVLGETFTNTAWLAAIGASVGGANLALYFVTNFSPNPGNIVTYLNPVITGTLAPYGNSGTAGVGQSAISQCFIQFSYSAAGPIDITLRIAAIQLERGSVRTPIILPPVGSPQVSSRGLIAGAGSFTPTGATINGTGNVRASIAPVAVPTGAVIAGGEANLDVGPLGSIGGNPVVVSLDVPPPFASGSTVYKSTMANGVANSVGGAYFIANPPAVPFVFRAWLWIPAGFTGTQVYFSSEAGFGLSLYSSGANLSLTNQWQQLTLQSNNAAVSTISHVLRVTTNNPADVVYTSLWQAVPDTVVAAPTIFGNTALGGIGSVTASATVLAAAGARIDARGLFSVDGRNFIPTGAQIDGRGGTTNYIRNPRAEGAVVGAPGALPTYWGAGAVAGITRSIVGSGVENGISYVDIRWNGTQTQAGVASNPIGFEAGPFVAPGRPGQQYTHSFYQKLVGGSVSGINNFYFVIYEYDASGTFLSTTNYTHPPPPPTTSLDANRASYVGTPTQATTAWIVPIWYLETSQNAVIDITVRLGGVQLEIGLVGTPLILPPVGTPGVSSRGMLAMPIVPAQAQATIGGVGSVSATAVALRPTATGIGGQGGQTNYIRNPRAEGAIAGTPGTLPTFWNIDIGSGITQQVIGSGIDTATGLSYVDIRLTSGGGFSTAVLYLDSFVNVVCANGDPFTTTLWVATVGGSQANIVALSYQLILPGGGGNSAIIGTSAALVPYTFSAAATAFGPLGAACYIQIVSIGGGIDITLRIAGAQLERGSIATPLILPPVGAPQISTRALLAMPTTLALPQQIIAGQGGKTNYITNPRGDGAAIGTPGTLPANWSYGTRLAGLSTAIIGTGTEAGIPYVDIRWFGTSTDIVTGVAFSGMQEIASYWLEPWVLSAYLKVIAGDSSQIVFNMNTQAISANGVYLTEYYNAVVPAGSNTPLDQARLSTMTTYATDVNLSFVRPVVLLRFATELAVDVTLRIGAPQLEIRSLSSVIMPPPIVGLFGLRTSRGVEAKPTAIVQAAAQINGEGLIGADSSFVGQARANATLAGVGNIIITGLRQRFAAHAAIHGTGSVTVGFAAKEAVKARLLGVGGVQATAAVAHPTIARIRGVGQIAARSLRVRYASATIAGNSRLYATAFPAKSGNVTVGGAGLLRVRDTIIAVLQTAAATITGTAAVHVQGRRAPPCDGLIEAEGNVYATAIVQAAGQALVAGVGTVDAHGIAQRTAAALLDGEGAVRGLLNQRPVALIGIDGAGQVAADGTPVRQTYGVAALIAGVGRVRADAFRAATVAAEALIAGLGAVLAIGLRAAVVNVDKTIAGVGNVRATVSRVIVAAQAQIDGSSWLRVDSVTITQVNAAATIQGTGGAVAHAARSQHARATIAGASSVTARGSVWAPALALIAGAGALVAGHRKAPFPIYARVGGTGSVSAVATVMVAAHVRIAGHADMADVAATLHAEAQVRISVHGWLIERAKSQLEAHATIAGEGDLAFDGEQLSHHHTSALIAGRGHIETDASKPREQIASQGVYLPPQLVGVSVL